MHSLYYNVLDIEILLVTTSIILFVGIPVHVRASSDPVVSLRSQMITPKPTPVRSSTIQTSSCHNYSSKGDILKEVFSKYPPPQPTVASLRAQRPSSATSLRVGQITNLYRNS